MNRLLLMLAIALGQLFTLTAASAQACSASPSVRAGVFNTDGYYRLPDMEARTAALAQQLPQIAQNLDVLCLNDLRASTGRTASLANLDRTVWNVYQPARLSGCRNACLTNTTIAAKGFVLPHNKWVEYCSLTPVPGQSNVCTQLSDPAQYAACVNSFCPFIAPPVLNEQCYSCLTNPVPSESATTRVFRCTGTHIGGDANRCDDAGATLVSRYPLLATEYREFPTGSVSTGAYGVDNWGVAYAQVQTSMGKVHLFCSSQVAPSTPDFDYSRLASPTAQQLNAVQTQDLLSYISSKTSGEPVIFLGDTGSGPAVAASPTGTANAQWAGNFAMLQSGGLSDALLANIGPNSQPAPAATCTFGCGAAGAAYSSHIMTAGSGKTPQGNDAALCARNGGTFLTTATASTANGTVPISRHVGVRADIGLQYRALPAVAWARPANLVYGSALGSTQLNATADVPGVFRYTPATGTVLPIGADQTLQVSFTPNDLINYAPVTGSTAISVSAVNGTAANLVVQRTLARDSSRNIVVNLTVANNGGTPSGNVTVTSLKLGAAAGASIPQSLGSIPAGGTATSSHTIPNSGGLASGAASTLSVAGVFTGSSFNSSSRITLP